MNKKLYLQMDGLICPFCESEDITHTGEYKGGDMGSGDQPCKCNSCNKRWYDIYQIVDIEEIDN